MEFQQFFRRSFAMLIAAALPFPVLVATETISILPGKGIGTLDLSTVFRIVHRGVRGEFSSQRHKAFPAVAECKSPPMKIPPCNISI